MQQREQRGNREHLVAEEVEWQNGFDSKALGHQEHSEEDDSSSQNADHLQRTPIVDCIAAPGESQQEADGSSGGEHCTGKVNASYRGPTGMMTAARRDVGGQVDQE